MIDVPDIVDVSVGFLLGTSDHCFVSCVLRVKQAIQDSQASHLQGECLQCSQCSTWSDVLKSPDPLKDFNCDIGDLIVGIFPPVICLRELGIGNGLILVATELNMLSRLLTVPGVEQQCI